MTDNNNTQPDNLAQKLKGKELPLVSAIREYFSSIMGMQKCDHRILNAFQESVNNTLQIPENNNTTKK